MAKCNQLTSLSFKGLRATFHHTQNVGIFIFLSQSNAVHTIQVTWLPSPRSEAQALVCLPVCGGRWWVLLQHFITLKIIFNCRVWYHTLSLCYVCIRASSSPARLPLWQI